MKPGWYSQAQSPETAAHFDGETWGGQTDLKSLDSDIRSSITVLPEEPSAPPTVPAAVVPAVSALDQPKRVKKGGAGWWWGISAGAILGIIGIIYGFQPAGNYCSAPFKDSSIAEYMDAYAPTYGYRTDYAGECVAALASAKTTTWVLIGFGILVSLASALIMATVRAGKSRAATAAPAVQSMASKIEDLARLRDQGLITAEEYEWKRQELLRS